MHRQAANSRGTDIRIIGLGNEFLSDDGAGIRVARALRERLPAQTAEIEELAVGGLELLSSITGCDRCIIVDAVTTGAHPPGTTYRFVQPPGADPPSLSSSHQVDLSQVVTLASLLGADLPRLLLVYGIEADDVTTFHDGCTEKVSRAIPGLVNAICRDVRNDDITRSTAGGWHIIGHPD